MRNLILIALIFTAMAMLEHEAGRDDWLKKSFGGRIVDLQFSPAYPEMAIILTDSLLSGVAKEWGRSDWRKSLDGPGWILKTHEKYALVFKESRLFVYGAKNGELLTSLNIEETILDAGIQLREGQ